MLLISISWHFKAGCTYAELFRQEEERKCKLVFPSEGEGEAGMKSSNLVVDVP